MKTRSSVAKASKKAAQTIIKTSTKPKISKSHTNKKDVKKPNSAGKGTKSNLPWYTIFTKGDKQYDTYMANEWSFEKRGDEPMFEKISLEGAQSGLSWLTILRKRDAYRRVFHHFDIDLVASMTDDDVERILNEQNDDTRNIIVRHRGKVESVINNAKCIQKLRLEAKESGESKHELGVFDNFVWSFVENKPILSMSRSGDLKECASQTPESQAMSKALKKLGFRFVGPTTCYSVMQSVGMAIDHPKESPEWLAACERLESREGGYQER